MSTVTDPTRSPAVDEGRLGTARRPTRFRPPSGPRHLVRRERLLELLDDLTEYPVVAIVSPAGSGKTVLAADWLAHRRRPCAWVALCADDRDPEQLVRSLLTALDPALAGTKAAQDVRTGEDLAAFLAGTARAGRVARPMTLVVDDVHRVDADENARAVLVSLVEHRPSWLRLLLLSRRRPQLPVERLRASGELADIGFSAVRFTDDEAVGLMTRLCPSLPEVDLTAAVRRADGWGAALQLTGLAIRSHPVTTHPFSDSTAAGHSAEQLINEYLWEEVLGPASPELVGVLVSTAVVERVNHGLAEALAERPDAGDLLEEAEAAGLFVTAVEGGWFEVHSLVRHLMTARLRDRWPDGVHKQHARAAQWLENAGDLLAALDHWLYAERHVDALRVLSELVVPLLDSGRAARVLEALELIPAGAANADPGSAVRHAWCRVLADPSGSLDAVSVAESLALGAPEPARSRLETLRATSAWLRADWHRAVEIARGALDETQETVAGDPVDRFAWRVVGWGIALDEHWDDAEPDVLAARAGCLADDSSRWSFEGTRAIGLALAGRPLESLRVIDAAKQVADSGRHQALCLELALAEAITARELDHREAARGAAEDLALTPAYPDPIVQLVAQLELVRLRMDAGDLETAGTQLDAADAMHADLARPGRGNGMRGTTLSDMSACDLVARAGVDLALATDDPTTALRWSAKVSDTFWSPTYAAKILLARGRLDEAADAMRRAVPRCPRHEVISGLLLARVLAREDRTAASETIVGTLDLAARHAMLRTVAAEGAPVMELIELAAWRVPTTWMDRLRHAMVPVWTGQDAQRPIDDLTDREREVLRLLPSRLTLSEVASELYVSQNTVKFHVRAIYRKLGAASRAEAVDAARQMRLLPR